MKELTFREVIEAVREMNCNNCPFFKRCVYPQSGEIREAVCNVNICEIEEKIKELKK